MNKEVCPISGETKMEELVNHWTHRIALLLSLVGLPILIFTSGLHGNLYKIVAYSIFGISLVLLYIASTYYHGSKTLREKENLRIVDHACIYLLIAGSYTPFAFALWDFSGSYLLAAEWTIAVVGISLKFLVFDRMHVASLIMYLVMGWLIVLWWPHLGTNIPLMTLILVGIGGLFYTFGVIFFLWDSLPFNHAIWHMFVFAGSVSHYLAVLLL